MSQNQSDKSLRDHFYIKSFLHSFSQIMLQENRWTGLLFLLGLVWGDVFFGLASALAVAVGIGTAQVFGWERSNISKGLYGFSPALVGVALMLAFPHWPWVWGLIVLGSVGAASLQELFLRKQIPGYTFPFILVTWVLYFVIHTGLGVEPSMGSLASNGDSPWVLAVATIKSFGEVIFQDDLVSGGLFVIGVFLSSPVAGFFGVGASLLAVGVGFLGGLPWENVCLGLYGFNGVLTAIAFAGRGLGPVAWGAGAVLLTIGIQVALLQSGLLGSLGGVYTSPFVFATWGVLLIKKWTVGNGRASWGRCP